MVENNKFGIVVSVVEKIITISEQFLHILCLHQACFA